MDLLDHVAPSTKQKPKRTNTARKSAPTKPKPKKTKTSRPKAPQPRAKAAKATISDLRPLHDAAVEVELEEGREMEPSKNNMELGMSYLSVRHTTHGSLVSACANCSGDDDDDSTSTPTDAVDEDNWRVSTMVSTLLKVSIHYDERSRSPNLL